MGTGVIPRTDAFSPGANRPNHNTNHRSIMKLKTLLTAVMALAFGATSAMAKDDDTPKITVKVQFWGRDVKIDNLEFWQVDKV